MKNILLVSGTYIAALIGAGLASGAETVVYFARFGTWGAFGVGLCSVVFGFFLYALLSGMKRTDASDFNEYLKKTTSAPVGNICNTAMLLFMICVYSAMVTGAGELIEMVFGIRRIFSMALFSLLCIGVILLPINKIMSLCGALGIFIGIIITFFCLRFLSQRGVETFKVFDNWLVSSVSYSGYNILSSVGILCPLAAFMKNKRAIVASSVFSGVGIFLILICMYCACGLYLGKINLGTFPMLTLSLRQGIAWYTVYICVFFSAVFTTAISSAYGVYSSFKNLTGSKLSVLILFVLSILLAYLGFKTLVSTVYMICGIFGIIVPVTVIKNEIKKV